MKTFVTACDPWGVSVERVEVKNISVAREMVKSLAVEAQASREVSRSIRISPLKTRDYLGKRSSYHAKRRRTKPGENKVRILFLIWFLNVLNNSVRAAADEMQECSASIVLKYLQVNIETFKISTSQI